MKLFPHQKRILDENPNNALLAHEGGTGKSIIGAEWLKKRTGYRLIVCPKRIMKKWRALVSDDIVVLSKEEFTKQHKDLPTPSAIVIDEADEFASPLFVAKLRSNRTTAMYHYLMQNPKCHRLLLTATPIRSTPWNLHTLLCFMGYYFGWKVWQKKFFVLEKRPYLPRMAWFARKTWRTDIRKVLEKYADIVLLQDCVDYLPPVTNTLVKVKSPPYPQPDEESPSAEWVQMHRHENGAQKIKVIKDIASNYRKAVIVCHYRLQLDEYYKVLSKDRQVYIIHGGIKDQEDVILQAQADDECLLLVQASLAAGYDLDTFATIIFASMSYKVVDYVQMKFRVRRIHNLQPVDYHYLIGGKYDKAVYDTIQLGRDFVPSEYASTR